MFKDLLTKTVGETIEKDKNQSKFKQETDIFLKFHEILCPKSNKPISLDECKKCNNKKEYFRKHDLGLTLTTTICTWSITE